MASRFEGHCECVVTCLSNTCGRQGPTAPSPTPHLSCVLDVPRTVHEHDGGCTEEALDFTHVDPVPLGNLTRQLSINGGLSLPCEGPGGSRSSKWGGVQVEASCHSETMWLMCEDIKLGIETPDGGPQEEVMNYFHTSVEPSLPQIDNAVMTKRPMPIDDILCKKCNDKVLRGYYRNRFNLVLDSVNPQLTPHIVITPAIETWGDFAISWRNRVDAQWLTNLVVPPYNISHVSLPPTDGPLRGPEDPSRYMATTTEPTVVNETSPEPKKVFCAARLIRYHEKFKSEIEIYPHLVQMLELRQYQASILMTNFKALSLKDQRVPSGHDTSVEKPFKWTDPAEPILFSQKFLMGITIIDSPNPFTAPHIVITAPPPQDPSIAWQNATNDPQDCGFGQYLTVPTRLVKFENTPYDGWEPWLPPVAVPVDGDDDDCETLVSDDETEMDPFPSLSRPETPTPLTPMGGWEDDEMNLLQDGEHDSWKNLGFLQQQPLREMETIVEDPEEDPKCPAKEAQVPQPSRPIFTDDDEDDDLPPFDDWYQSVARRAQLGLVPPG